MKSILMSIQPKWCELIANGKKTIEVRKTRPNIKSPFKVYVYCTVNGGSLHSAYDGLHYHKSNIGKNDTSCINGKVIGEFACDHIIPSWGIDFNYKSDNVINQLLAMCEGSCLTSDEIIEYSNGEKIHLWHISNLIIYDKPKELNEFKKPNQLSIIDKLFENGCNNKNCKFAIPNSSILNDDGYCDYDKCPKLRITKPPQSWCYVEEILN